MIKKKNIGEKLDVIPDLSEPTGWNIKSRLPVFHLTLKPILPSNRTSKFLSACLLVDFVAVVESLEDGVPSKCGAGFQ